MPGRLMRFGTIAPALVCNALEWYDFSIFGLLAPYMARTLFPSASAASAVLSTFALFGIGFCLRPLGGIVLGRIGDRRGRKPALLLTIALMALGTALIACVPSYRAFGLAAPAWLLAARLLQGFSAGGEWGVANAFLTEWAAPHRRGFSASLLSVTVAIGSLTASAVTGLVVATLTPAAMAAWGWRLPFAIGAVLGLAGLWARARTAETPALAARPVAVPSPPATRKPQWAWALRVFGLSVHWNVCYYIFLIYMPAFTRLQGGLTAAQAMGSNAVCLAAIAGLVPVCGWLSDRLGRKPLMLASCAIVMLATLPALWLIQARHGFGLVLGVQLLFAGAIALYSGAAPALIAESVPPDERCQWTSAPYALSAAIFGGFAPFVADGLIKATGNALAPSAYVIAAAAISFVSLSLSRQAFSAEMKK